MPKTKSDEKARKETKKAEKKPKKAAKAAAVKTPPAKAGKPILKSKTVKAKPVITDEDIALRAYYIAERRTKLGWHGDAASDWVDAEKQLRAEAR